ncbi:hypothetical protein predicted by Glimmer/Critica [Streptococcus dysgalactiae subsp. equisimilis AC-2713]|uniref:Uncharacterized protein n=1 Tax=Streptococcus dysgalactiae subsp. equisimilis AC-2713 TaxID=759913 RepID=A0AB33R5E5_STREQ|nr:hypothetical protein predicted by Glimmer/Critica [Streptococcus dysgalactiae subsp. equisimilis AC-2713]
MLGILRISKEDLPLAILFLVLLLIVLETCDKLI